MWEPAPLVAWYGAYGAVLISLGQQQCETGAAGFRAQAARATKGRWQWHDHGSNATSATAVTVPGLSETGPRRPASGSRSAPVQWLKLTKLVSETCLHDAPRS